MKRAIKLTTYAILISVLLLVLLAYLVPSALGTTLAVVLSGSMEPALPTGSLAIMTPTNPSEILVGDIIAFHPPWEDDVVISHRVVEILNSGFGTKGDANDAADPYIIPSENVVAKVSWSIPHLGYSLEKVRGFASSLPGFFLLILLPATLILGSTIQDVNFMVNPSKRRARLLKKRNARLKNRAPASWQLRRI